MQQKSWFVFVFWLSILVAIPEALSDPLSDAVKSLQQNNAKATGKGVQEDPQKAKGRPTTDSTSDGPKENCTKKGPVDTCNSGGVQRQTE